MKFGFNKLAQASDMVEERTRNYAIPSNNRTIKQETTMGPHVPRQVFKRNAKCENTAAAWVSAIVAHGEVMCRSNNDNNDNRQRQRLVQTRDPQVGGIADGDGRRKQWRQRGRIRSVDGAPLEDEGERKRVCLALI
jgi:hypothetical protein